MEGGRSPEKAPIKIESEPVARKTFHPVGIKSRLILAAASLGLALGVGVPSDEEIERKRIADEAEKAKEPKIIPDSTRSIFDSPQKKNS